MRVESCLRKTLIASGQRIRQNESNGINRATVASDNFPVGPAEFYFKWQSGLTRPRRVLHEVCRQFSTWQGLEAVKGHCLHPCNVCTSPPLPPVIGSSSGFCSSCSWKKKPNTASVSFSVMPLAANASPRLAPYLVLKCTKCTSMG